ncbi:MAG: FHA domain-containing protein [Acidobacteria bacterium]|nr:FHA domain-containing protein [Acidobacteriota bacterium]
MVVRFGDCAFDGEARELRRAGRTVPLSPRAFQLLALLVEASPRALSHDQLHEALWPDVFVGYSSLAKLVAEVRRAVGDPSLIRTLPRFGYALAAAPVAGSLTLPVAGVLVDAEREYAIPAQGTLVGRGADCGVRLPSRRVSRVHARLGVDGGQVWIEDAGSRNGTWINGHRQNGRVVLSDGDEVTVGGWRLVFKRADPDGSAQTLPWDRGRRARG